MPESQQMTHLMNECCPAITMPHALSDMHWSTVQKQVTKSPAWGSDKVASWWDQLHAELSAWICGRGAAGVNDHGMYKPRLVKVSTHIEVKHALQAGCLLS
jgi:hypothetical protein